MDIMPHDIWVNYVWQIISFANGKLSSIIVKCVNTSHLITETMFTASDVG